MGHHHHHHGHHHQHKLDKSQAGTGMLTAFFLNAGFAVVEFIGGHYTNSVSIKSDAIHDFGDSLTLLFSYFAEKFSHKKEDESFTFGYRRFSVLAAMINGLILLAGTIYVVIEAVARIRHPEPIDAQGMIGFAFLGIIVNGLAAFKLKKENSINGRMIMLHLMEDILGWAAVLLVSIVLLFKPWYVLDAILSIFISFIILKGVLTNFKSIGSILLQKFPETLEREIIQQKILHFSHVEDVHLVRGWSVDESKFNLSFHVRVALDTTISQLDDLREEIEAVLREENVLYSTIQFEGKECSVVAEAKKPC